MMRRKYVWIVLGLVSMLILSSLAVSNVAGSRAVNFKLDLTDPKGDAEGDDPKNRVTDDADITKVKSSESEAEPFLQRTTM